MAFLDKLTSLAKNAAEMTGDLLEAGSMNAKISSEKGKVLELKQHIGEYYWAKYNAGETIDPEPSALCAEIQAMEERAAAMQAELQAKKEAARTAETSQPAYSQELMCTACGVANAPGTKFCRECGSGLKERSAVCSCGAQIPAECKFCPKCGAPVREVIA